MHSLLSLNKSSNALPDSLSSKDSVPELHVCLLQVNIRQLKAGMRMVPSIAALGRKCTHMLVVRQSPITSSHLGSKNSITNTFPAMT